MWFPGMTLDDVEKKTLESALQFFHWNKTHTAKALGIALMTLHNKIKKYNLEKLEDEKDNTSHQAI